MPRTFVLMAILLPACSLPARAGIELRRVTAGTDSVTLHLTQWTAQQIRVLPDPPRIVIDLPDTVLALRRRTYRGSGRFLKKVRCALFAPEPDPVSRVVLDLDSGTDYRTGWHGTDFTIILGKKSRLRRSVPRSRKAAPRAPPVKAASRIRAAAVKPAAAPAKARAAAGKPGALPASAYMPVTLPVKAEEQSLGEGMTARSSCGDETCFMKSYKECSPAAISYTLSEVLTYRYEVLGPQKGRCRMRMRSVANPNPSWVGKEMTCRVDNAEPFDRAVSDLKRCDGPLKSLMTGG